MTDILKEKKAIIFDLDGTLVDSMWMWKRIDMEFLARYGHQCPPKLQKAIEGMSFTETAMYFKEKFCLPLTAEQIKRVWIEMSIDKYRSQVPAKRGAKEFLSYARDRGMLCGIATSNSWEMVDAVLDSLSGCDHGMSGEGRQAQPGYLSESGRRSSRLPRTVSGV